MAAQVREKDFEFTQGDIDRLSDALKDKEFRKLLSEYCEEIQDPANRALYQCEITELEKQRGVDVTFINPLPGYVIKSSVGGDKKAFINVCTNENIAKPSYSIKREGGQRGIDWQLPFSIAPPHDDFDKKRNRCVVYDVVFHPNTLRMAEKNAQFKNMLNETACDAVESNHSVSLDRSNIKFPKLSYKGVAVAAVVRKPNPNFNPDTKPAEDPSLLDEIYPQRNYPIATAVNVSQTKTNNIQKKIDTSGYAVPKYVIKQRRDIDIKEFTYEKDAKKHSAIPSSLIIEVNLPLLSSSAEAILDVKDKVLSLVSEKPARYMLELTLPYRVDDNAGSAKFDLSKRILIISLPVIPEKMDITWRRREDSGVDSDSNSPSASDEDNSQSHSLVTEISDSLNSENDCKSEGYRTTVKEPRDFLLPDLSYSMPPFTCNVLDNIIAFTLHVKNVDPESIKSQTVSENNGIQLKFSSVGAGFFPIHHALFLKFPAKFECEKPEIEAWDNNVVMQVEIINANMPDHYSIGLTEKELEEQSLNVPVTEATPATKPSEIYQESVQPIIEVSARGNNEMSISLTVADAAETEEHDSDNANNINIIPKRAQENSYDSGIASSNGSFKGILKCRPSRIGRSYSESSVDFMEYASPSYSLSSADCIPEEDSSSLKKTVRFSNVIAKQTFRSNSSILGQKSKNQRKKRNKKRAQERRASEGDPEDEDSTEALHDEVFMKSDSSDCNGNSEKHRKDSDIDDGETDKDDSAFKAARKAHQKVRNIPSFTHKNALKGKYQEVNFKNDLIFDLDM